MSARNLKLPSPLRRSPESYETAAKEIEQEKQMVAALKRLSMGQLMARDPDMPSDDDYMFERGPGTDDTALLDPFLPDSKLPLPLPRSDTNTPPEGDENKDDLDANTLFWVPANVHPEVNPQQFKKHVKSTIDELLERKLSRSKSNRSKRSSLSFSTTDQSFEDELKVPEEQKKRFSNPSLRELSTELEALSRLAGMDSNDAVTLARSLSTSSVGYTDVEKMAFDELNLPTTPVNANQAELLDFGVEESSPSRKSYHRIPQQHPQTPPFGPDHTARNYRNQQAEEEFALRRSRRLDYRKAHASSYTQLGLQLQHSKAEKLAELRHNLTSSPRAGDRLTPSKASRLSMQSMQSINPRSSQMLFSYRNPAAGPLSPSTPTNRVLLGSKSSPMPGPSVRDSPYASASPHQHHGQQLHHTKYGQHNLTSKQLGTRLRTALHEQLDETFRKVSGHGKDLRPSSRNSSGGSMPNQRQVSPQTQFAPQQHQHHHRNGQSYQQQQGMVPQKGPLTPQMGPGASSNIRRTSQGHAVPLIKIPPQSQPQGQVLNQQQPLQGAQPGYAKRHTEIPVYSKRDKTRQLNQNLDLLRNEINEFKESLSRADPKSEPVKEPEETKNVPDVSFDITSHDVSYEDSLGIEQDVLKELNTDKPRSPKTSARNSLGELKENVDEKETVHHFQIKFTGTPVDDVKDSKVTPAYKPMLHRQESTPTIEISDETVEAVPEFFAKKVRDPVYVEANDDKELLPAVKNLENGPQSENKISSVSKTLSEYTDSIKQETKKSEPMPEVVLRTSVTPVADEMEATMSHLENEPEITDSKKKKSVSSSTSDKDRKKTKKWLWSKDKSTSSTAVASQEVKVPSRSISSPEVSITKKEKELSKESVITKLFKKKRSNSVSNDSLDHLRISLDSSASVEYDAADQRGKRRVSSNSRQATDDSVPMSNVIEEETRSEGKRKQPLVEENTVTSRIKNKLKNITKGYEEKPEEPALEKLDEEDLRAQSTLEVQEKLKKSIRRSSRANQPIEFTDSAFGFPLPPPSHSTLVMLDYRFPVHVERAIYRLSHLKLANPKRSLREQVLLSNFMYAYLNLVDHTLHLEQQMSADEPLDEPEADMVLFNNEDADTEFEADGDDFDDNGFDSIRLDLDSERHIAV